MRILMLGNSLTTANGLPDLLADYLQAEVVVHARGGARLSEHLNPNTRLGKLTQQALAEQGWDYVVIQEMSNGPVRFRERFLETTGALANMARSAGATPVLYATWAYAPDCGKLDKLGLSRREMHERMHEAALEAALESGALLADVCLAFFEHPDAPSLFAPDGVHPTVQGTEVALKCLVATITGAETESAPSAAPAQPYFVYLLRCEDGSYYTGITTDIERRLKEHLSRGPKAARYTRTHPVVALAASWEALGRAQASRLEARVKQLTHRQKAALAENPELIESLLEGSI